MRPPLREQLQDAELAEEVELEEDDNEEEGQRSIQKGRQGVMTLIDMDTFLSSPVDLDLVARNQAQLATALNAIMTHLSSYSATSAGKELVHTTYTDKYVKQITITECKSIFDKIVTTNGMDGIWSFGTKERYDFLAHEVFPKFHTNIKGGRLSASDSKVAKVL